MEQVRADILASLTALDAIPKPFIRSISTDTARPSIATAQAAIRSLQATLEKDVLPLFQR